jgi:hypothetical protein
MVKKLYTKTKIFFPNPYVIRLDYNELDTNIVSSSYRSALKMARKNIHGTWGYCLPEYEVIGIISPDKFNAISYINQLSKMRSYWCFADEMDALQFCISVGTSATRVDMWPERFFTIQEVVDIDES